MQTSAMASPAKIGLRIEESIFRFAIAKAEALQPAVLPLRRGSARVTTESGKGLVTVNFYPFPDGIWALCTCQERRAPWDYPKPCFHVAAAAIARGIFSVASETPILLDEESDELYDCPNAPNCAPGLCHPACCAASEMAEKNYQEDARRFCPAPRESFAFDVNQVAAQARRLKIETGWEL